MRRAQARERGFTITELLIVVGILAVVSAVAVSYVRWGARDSETWANAIGRTLSAARARAVSGRQWYRVTLAGSASTASTITTEYTQPGAPPTGNDCTASTGWTQDPSLTRTAPREAMTWKASQTSGAPSSPGTVSLMVCFRPDFTQAVRVSGDTTNYLNAYVYVGPLAGVKGWNYRVALEGVGVVNVTNPW